MTTIDFTLRGEHITLDALLKATGLADSGGRAKALVAAGKVQVVPVGAAESVTLAWDQSVGIVKMMVTGIKQIVVGERSVKELGGPIKIAKYSGERFSLGWPRARPMISRSPGRWRYNPPPPSSARRWPSAPSPTMANAQRLRKRGPGLWPEWITVWFWCWAQASAAASS